MFLSLATYFKMAFMSEAHVMSSTFKIILNATDHILFQFYSIRTVVAQETL